MYRHSVKPFASWDQLLFGGPSIQSYMRIPSEDPCSELEGFLIDSSYGRSSLIQWLHLLEYNHVDFLHQPYTTTIFHKLSVVTYE